MSFGKSKTKTSSTSTGSTTENQSQTQTLDPAYAAQMEAARKGVLGTIDQFNTGSPYRAYTGPLVAKQNDTERAAKALVTDSRGVIGDPYAEARALATKGATAGPSYASSPVLGEAAGILTPDMADVAKVNGPKFGPVSTYEAARTEAANVDVDQILARLNKGDLDKYVNPELERVVDTSLADFDNEATRLRSRDAAQAAGQKMFAGDGYAIRKAALDSDLTRGRASTAANLRKAAYDTALGAIGEDVNSTNTGNIAQANLAQQAAASTAAAENARRAAEAAAKNNFTYQEGVLGYDAEGRNADAANRRSSEVAGYDFETGRFNADSKNRRDSEIAAYADTNSRFNAGQDEAFATRQLQGAGVIGDFASRGVAETMQQAEMLRTMGLDERQIEDLAILREMAQTDKRAADELQRIQLELNARMGVLGSYDSLVNTNISRTGTTTGTGNSTSTTRDPWGAIGALGGLVEGAGAFMG